MVDWSRFSGQSDADLITASAFSGFSHTSDPQRALEQRRGVCLYPSYPSKMDCYNPTPVRIHRCLKCVRENLARWFSLWSFATPVLFPSLVVVHWSLSVATNPTLHSTIQSLPTCPDTGPHSLPTLE